MKINIRQWIKDFTADLNQPAFKAVIAAVLTLATGASYFITMQVRVWTGYCKLAADLYAICRGDLQEEAWWAWLAFLAALWGVTFLDYRTKRQTTHERHEPSGEGAAQEHEPPPPAEQGG
jgi:hypothetical protein